MASKRDEIVRYSVPVTPELDAEVRKRMRDGGFSSVAEYVRTTVRADLERARKERLENLLLEGLESGDGAEVSPEYWEKRRRELNARLAQRRREEEA
jgi:antitoxin ParD1/3/4